METEDGGLDRTGSLGKFRGFECVGDPMSRRGLPWSNEEAATRNGGSCNDDEGPANLVLEDEVGGSDIRLRGWKLSRTSR